MKPLRGRKSMDMSILTRLRSLRPGAEIVVDEPTPLAERETEVSEPEEDDSMKPEGLVLDLIEYTIALGASDLFFAVEQDDIDITLRHLGVIRQVARLPHDIGQ